MRTALAMVVGLALVTGCGAEDLGNLDPSWPALEGMYGVESGAVVCSGAVDVQVLDGGNRITCVWNRVVVDGKPRCTATVTYERDDAGSPWGEPVVFVTHATVCADAQATP